MVAGAVSSIGSGGTGLNNSVVELLSVVELCCVWSVRGVVLSSSCSTSEMTLKPERNGIKTGRLGVNHHLPSVEMRLESLAGSSSHCVVGGRQKRTENISRRFLIESRSPIAKAAPCN